MLVCSSHGRAGLDVVAEDALAGDGVAERRAEDGGGVPQQEAQRRAHDGDSDGEHDAAPADRGDVAPVPAGAAVLPQREANTHTPAVSSAKVRTASGTNPVPAASSLLP